jgi:hypothetical protein
MPGSIREQYAEYRKAVCEWCFQHLSGDGKVTDVLEQSRPTAVHKVYPPHVSSKFSQYLPCTALPFEDWAAARIERLETVTQLALDHVLELEEAWRTGALSEHDGKGGTRSNRNADVRLALRKALAVQPEKAGVPN